MNAKTRFITYIIYALIFLLILFAGLVLFVQCAYAQEAECVLVWDDNDDPGFYDELNFTDSQGRDVCKVRVVFHQPAEGDPNGAVFTESGSINGYTADFNGASVHVWRSGSDYSISHSKVWVLEAAPPPTEVPPTDVPPTDTEEPPTSIPPTPTATATLPPGVTPTATPTLPPGVTPTITPTLIPPVTNQPPTPGTTPGHPVKTQVPMLPQTGFGEMTDANLGLWFGVGLLLGLLALVVHIVRAR